MTQVSVIAWLMEGDPVIRWQTLRDLCNRSAEEWQAEQRQTLQSGWGARFLESLRADGTWPEGRWTGTLWTLLTLVDCGLPPDHPPLRDAAYRFLDQNLTPERAVDEDWLLKRVDLCHLGFWLRIGAYFLGNDARLAHVAGTVLRAQMPDGGWNCRKRNYPQTQHSSFHTTFNILEGLSLAAEFGAVSMSVFRQSETRALEFMLAHQMYRSDRTGEIIHERFTHLIYPSYWHYTALRGLDYLRDRREIGNPRLEDPIDLLASRRRANGRWPVEQRIPGMTLFDMEKQGGDSRWNTLRALRVLQCRQKELT
ncbi:MAG TPA: hypothetical protein VKU00_33130 [Chthonomonadaceae bacterium]|nr:hypothetical protein [Chthonomonadaceae bacterium]